MADKLVVIEDTTITSLLSNPKLLSTIPALKTAASVKNPGSPTCKPCARKASAKAINYSHVKKVIANLRGEMLSKLKQELGATKIRVIFKNEQNKLIQVTM
jgi:hypothetical protein